MWFLTIRSPSSEPTEYIVPAGKTILGRKPDNDLVIADESASRIHAELEYDPHLDVAVLRDLGSTNGTFVNRERLAQPRLLAIDDQIRIGQHLIHVSRQDQASRAETGPEADTQPLTLELLLEAVDQHAVLLYEVAQRLNTVLDLQTALAEVSRLMRISMGAQKCEVILAEHFGQLAELGFPTTIARRAIERRSVVAIPDLSAMTDRTLGQSALLLHVRAVLCVPVLIGEEVVALTYVYKTDPASRPFSQPDIQLAVAISHQAALTIQRAHLLALGVGLLAAGQRRRGRADGGHDIGIAGAAADIARQLLANLLFGSRPVAPDEVARGDEHSRRAEPALQPMMLVKGLAQHGHHPIIGEAFDGPDVALVAGDGECQARAHGFAVDQDRACPADAVLAAEMRAGQVSTLAQKVGEREPRRHVVDHGLAVHAHAYPGHVSTCPSARDAIASCRLV